MTFELTDARGRARYQIERLNKDEARVLIIVADDLQAAQTLGMDQADFRELVGFFEELARDWKGWSETKVWRLRDERTSLEASHDGLGHVSLVARLFPLLYDLDWCVRATVAVESGQLEALASRLRRAVNEA